MKKKDEEEQEQKKQQLRFGYILRQTELYSHFMATKLGVAADQKKELENLKPLNNGGIEIDE